MSEQEILQALQALAQRGLRPCRNLLHIAPASGPCDPCQKDTIRRKAARYYKARGKVNRNARNVGW
jgi:hypothetical protein